MSWRGVTIRGFLFALIGAAATVLVAWAIATHQRSHHPHQSPIPGMVHSSISRFYPGDRPWPLHAHRQLKLPAVNPSEVHAWRGVGISVTLFATNLQELSASGLEFLELRDTGWPSPAMSEVRLVRRVGGPTDAIVIPRRSHPDSAFLLLPVNLLWPGFLVDTGFWGGAAFVVWRVPGFVRRGARRRRARCVRCGYELKALAVCPECGIVGNGVASS